MESDAVPTTSLADPDRITGDRCKSDISFLNSKVGDNLCATIAKSGVFRVGAHSRQVAPATIAALVACSGHDRIWFLARRTQLKVAKNEEFSDFRQRQLMEPIVLRQGELHVCFETVSDQFLLAGGLNRLGHDGAGCEQSIDVA